MKKLDPEFEAFVVGNGQALSDIHDDETMRAAVHIMCRAGVAMKTMVWRIRFACTLPQVAFNALLEYAEKHPDCKVNLAMAIGSYDIYQWKHEFGIRLPPNLNEFFRGQVGGVTWLYVQHHNGLIQSDHPFHVEQGGAADEFWAYQVRRFQATGDYQRAWDELNRARRGIVAKGTDQTDILKGQAERCFKASPNLLGELAYSLYLSMQDVLGPITPSDLDVPSSTVQGRVVETKLARNGRRPTDRPWTYRRPGYDFALGYRQEGDGNVFTQAGAAIIKLAAHFSAKQNEAKRRKHEKARAAFEAQHLPG